MRGSSTGAAHAPHVPAELELIIQQLLKKDPNERIPTALALSNRLRAMQYVLQRSDDDLEIAVAPLGDGHPHEDPTRIVEEPGPSAAVAPTAIIPDSSANSVSSGRGNDATLLSAHERPAAGTGKTPSSLTLADTGETRKNRFSWRTGWPPIPTAISPTGRERTWQPPACPPHCLPSSAW